MLAQPTQTWGLLNVHLEAVGPNFLERSRRSTRLLLQLNKNKPIKYHSEQKYKIRKESPELEGWNQHLLRMQIYPGQKRWQDPNELDKVLLTPFRIMFHWWSYIDCTTSQMSHSMLFFTSALLLFKNSKTKKIRYEEIHPPEIRDLVYITDRSSSRDDIIETEISILNALGFNISSPTMYWSMILDVCLCFSLFDCLKGSLYSSSNGKIYLS